MMSAARSKYAWIVLCLASIFISSKTGAMSFPSQSEQPLKISLPLGESFSNNRIIVSRSADDADANDNKDSDKPEMNTEPPSVQHQHGSHGPLGPVKHLLNTVRDRFHGNGGGPLGGIGAITSILGDRHKAAPHESPIETERDRQSSNSSTGLHVLEFLGTFFSQVWAFLSNIPAILARTSSSSGANN